MIFLVGVVICLEDCNAEARDPFVTLCTGVGDDEPELKEESAMATARELMTQGVECVNSTETLVEAARKMRDLDVGAMPICGEDQRLKGMLTDRDIVVKCIAEGKETRLLPFASGRKRRTPLS